MTLNRTPLNPLAVCLHDSKPTLCARHGMGTTARCGTGQVEL